MMFLIEIYTWEEHTPAKALPLSQQLHREYPKSPAMYLAEIMDHYELKQWDDVANLAQDYLAKITSGSALLPTRRGLSGTLFASGRRAIRTP